MAGLTRTSALLAGNGLARRHGESVALHPTSIEIDAGETVAIVGPNGCGKSTLLRALAGVVEPGATGAVGSPAYRDAASTTEALARVRAFVPQRPETHAEFTAREVVRLGRFARGEDAAAVDRALEAVGLSARAERLVHALSGGERQRVAVARALAQVDGASCPVLLLDEPFAGIDPGEIARLAGALRAIARRGAVVLSLHDPTLARAVASRGVVMREGRVIADGAADEVLSSRVLTAAYGHPMEESGTWLGPRLLFDVG